MHLYGNIDHPIVHDNLLKTSLFIYFYLSCVNDQLTTQEFSPMGVTIENI
jgi:hypothetical protein